MNKSKLRKLCALLLAVLTMIGSVGMLGVSAAGNTASVVSTSIEEVRALLNALSYSEYSEKYANVKDATKDITIDVINYNKEQTNAKVEVQTGLGGDSGKALYLPDEGTVTWNVTIPSEGKYTIKIEYYPVEGKSTSIERIFRINGKVPFSEARYITVSKVWTNLYEEADAVSGRRFKSDIDGNELRPTMQQTPEWRSYEFRDVDGFYTEALQFVFEAGANTISLEAVNEPMAIKSITLCAPVALKTYAEVKAEYDAKGYTAVPAGTQVKIDAEYPTALSTQNVYPINDRTSAVTDPQSSNSQLLNTIGGDKWETAGQWIRYTITVPTTGLYKIVPRFKQNILDGMYVSRTIRINGEIPFEEATKLRFDYGTEWQSRALNDGETEFEFYFEAGKTYEIEFDISLGSMGDVIRKVQDSLDNINADYLNILKLTGANPDEYRDYGFARVMPDTIIDLIIQSRVLNEVADYIANVAGTKSSSTGTLQKVYILLKTMGTSEDEIARNLKALKDNIGSLGTWISDAKTQPLQIDYISIQPEGDKLPQAKANAFQSLGFEFKSFFSSFFVNYNRMGATSEISDENVVEVWLAYGRDQSQVIRNLINNDFTPNSNIEVDLKLVAGNTLLPSVLAGMGPDVYIGLGEDNVINYAIRSAILPVDGFSDFEEVKSHFNEAAMVVMGITGADGVYHTYGIPETQSFPMMFYRKDILADLGIEVPKTWDDIQAAIPVLQANNMEIGLSKDYRIFLYQMGETLFADDGMRINLDSNVALESFDMMCNLFTMYRFPYQYDFENRFRTGEMPIGIAGYNGTYNKLIVFASELRGLWEFVPLPGIVQEDGTINNVSISTSSAIVMLNGCTNKDAAWEFIKWHAGADCQIKYSNEMVAILGPSAKHATANIDALASLPWTTQEYKNLNAQFQNLASIPNYPGSYIIGRYTNFAFLAAYNDKADPVDELLSYINTINKEITRKRKEFNLETLELGQTLAEKRAAEAAENGTETTAASGTAG